MIAEMRAPSCVDLFLQKAQRLTVPQRNQEPRARCCRCTSSAGKVGSALEVVVFVSAAEQIPAFSDAGGGATPSAAPPDAPRRCGSTVRRHFSRPLAPAGRPPPARQPPLGYQHQSRLATSLSDRAIYQTQLSKLDVETAREEIRDIVTGSSRSK